MFETQVGHSMSAIIPVGKYMSIVVFDVVVESIVPAKWSRVQIFALKDSRPNARRRLIACFSSTTQASDYREGSDWEDFPQGFVADGRDRTLEVQALFIFHLPSTHRDTNVWITQSMDGYNRNRVDLTARNHRFWLQRWLIDGNPKMINAWTPRLRSEQILKRSLP